MITTSKLFVHSQIGSSLAIFLTLQILNTLITPSISCNAKQAHLLKKSEKLNANSYAKDTEEHVHHEHFHFDETEELPHQSSSEYYPSNPTYGSDKYSQYGTISKKQKIVEFVPVKMPHHLKRYHPRKLLSKHLKKLRHHFKHLLNSDEDDYEDQITYVPVKQKPVKKTYVKHHHHHHNHPNAVTKDSYSTIPQQPLQVQAPILSPRQQQVLELLRQAGLGDDLRSLIPPSQPTTLYEQPLISQQPTHQVQSLAGIFNKQLPIYAAKQDQVYNSHVPVVPVVSKLPYHHHHLPQKLEHAYLPATSSYGSSYGQNPGLTVPSTKGIFRTAYGNPAVTSHLHKHGGTFHNNPTSSYFNSYGSGGSSSSDLYGSASYTYGRK